MRVTGDDLFLAVGLVVRVHGVRGAIKVKMYSGEADVLASVSSVFFQAAYLEKSFVQRKKKEGYLCFEIASVKGSRGGALVSLVGVDDVDLAQSLVGQKVFVFKQDLPETAEDEYYYYELVGFRAEDGDGNLIGMVSRVIPSPAHDILEIKTPGGEKMIPFVESFVPRVKREEKVVVLSPIKGMLDDEV